MSIRLHGGTARLYDDCEVVDTFADARDRDILNLAEEMEQDMEADKRLLGISHVEILFYHFVVPCLKKLGRISKSNIISV